MVKKGSLTSFLYIIINNDDFKERDKPITCATKLPGRLSLSM